MAKTNYGEELGWELDVDFPIMGKYRDICKNYI